MISFSQAAEGGENIGALGRIHPSGGIVYLAGPPGVTIERIFVTPGQPVAESAPLVLFASRELLDLEVAIAEHNLANVETTTANAIETQKIKLKTLEASSANAIALQEIKVKAAREDFDFASKALSRMLDAGSESYSIQQKEEKEHMIESSRINLDMTKRELERLTFSSRKDLELAKLELNHMEINRKIKLVQSKKQLDLSKATQKQAMLTAPVSGTILEVLQKKGEKSSGTLIHMADLSQMVVIAEVFQGDLLRMAPGMKATIQSKSLPKALTGRVKAVSRIIEERSKAANVTITLDDPETAAKLINLEVDVSISSGP